MRDPKTPGGIADQFERLVNTEGALRFLPVDKSAMHPATREFLETIIEPTGISCTIADVRLHGGAVLFKLDDERVPFVSHLPDRQTHMYADAGFHNALEPNKVLAYFARRAFGADEQAVRRLLDSLDEAAISAIDQD